MTSHSNFLLLPREIRHQIYVSLFSDLVFDRNNPHDCYFDRNKKRGLDPRLAILHVCRQIYAEASPLVLRHVKICCMDASDMLRCLMAMNPEQIRQLKYLNVCYSIVCFKLPCFQVDNLASASEQKYRTSGFHVGALLGLFPGLQLDLLVLEDGMDAGLDRYEACHGSDLIESLLQADGFREVRANIRAADDAFLGESQRGRTSGWLKDPGNYLPKWEESIRTRFRGRPGWSVELYINEAECPDEHWGDFRNAGVTLLDGLDERVEVGYERSENSCFVAGDYWSFRACRGKGPFATTQDNDRVLGCISDYFEDAGPLSAEGVKEASDRRRELFRASDRAKIHQDDEEAGMGADGPYEFNFL